MTVEVPKETEGDALHAMARGFLSTIPVIGGPVAELFQMVVQAPLERRREEWMQYVCIELQKLIENRGINLEDLGRNEKFVSAVMHATTIALRTHEVKKREALRNAVIHVAIGQSPEDALEHMFFEWIDSFSGMHLQVLRDSANPPPLFEKIGMRRSIGQQTDVEGLIWTDLYTRRLVGTERKSAFPERVITELGMKFLSFISK